MPRRVYTYLADTGWGRLNFIASIGASVLAIGVAVSLVNAILSWRRGARASDDPWGGDSLEWATSSPPPPHNFTYVPVVQGRAALWQRTPDRPVVMGMRSDDRYLLVTTAVDAVPEYQHKSPGPTSAPLMAALAAGATFIPAIFTPWAVPVGAVLWTAALVQWGWPRSAPDPGERVTVRGSES